MALARMGHSAIAADLDFGGSNLYHFLGHPNRNPGIGDFFSGHASDLKSLLVPTVVSNLHFLPGDGKTPLTANLPSAQKAKLLRHLRALPAEYLVLDIGAGSSYTTLDFYDAAELGLLVTTPERPAITGMLVFLKNHLYRKIEHRLSANGFRSLRPLLKELMQLPMADQPPSFGFIQGRIAEESRQAAEVVAATFDQAIPALEAVLARDPQVILSTDDTIADPGALWRRWTRVAAVRDGTIYSMPSDTLTRATPRLADGARQVCAALDDARAKRAARAGQAGQAR